MIILAANYIDEIEELIKSVPEDIVDLNVTRVRGRVPTQAFSEFITNREQGDWAESLIFNAINDLESDILSVKYGKSDKVIAGDPGFKEFYEEYQDELDNTGKRPDLLIFKKKDYNCSNLDISNIEDKHHEILTNAIAGLEVRSSAFLVEGYNEHGINKKKELLNEIAGILNELSPHVSTLPVRWKRWLSNIDYDNLETFDDVPVISGSIPSDIKEILRELKKRLKEFKQRDHLSFTPKVEDILVIFKWIQTYGIPHYYVQVFFDKVYAISFKEILKIISNSDLKGKAFTIEKNAKNQFKSTIHIDIGKGTLLADKIAFPEVKPNIKRLGRGRLLFYISFEGGNASLDGDKLIQLINE